MADEIAKIPVLAAPKIELLLSPVDGGGTFNVLAMLTDQDGVVDAFPLNGNPLSKKDASNFLIEKAKRLLERPARDSAGGQLSD
jgi:hypothetical protein